MNVSHILTPNLLYFYQSVCPLACINALHSAGSRYGNLSLSTMHQTCLVTQPQLAVCSSLLPFLLPPFLTSTFPPSLLRFLPPFFLLPPSHITSVLPLFPPSFPHLFVPFSPFWFITLFPPSVPSFVSSILLSLFSLPVSVLHSFLPPFVPSLFPPLSHKLLSLHPVSFPLQLLPAPPCFSSSPYY